MEEEVKGLGDYLDIIWRRKLWVIVPSVLLSAIAIAVAMWLPPTYKSQGTILIESQEIPHNLIESTVTSYADQRIEVIKQRLLSTERAMQIINKYNLYADEKKKSPSTSGLVALFRTNVNVSLVQANVTDPRSGRATRANIAFNVSFMDRSPRVAQQVANELVTQFLEENVKTRSLRAEETKTFLKEEADKFQNKVQQIEKQIAEFKDQYSDSLPELLQYNLTMISSLQKEMSSNQNEIMVLKDQVSTMSLGLSTTTPYLTTSQQSTQSGTPSSSEALLEKLRVEYNASLGKYEPNHPDVIRLKKQIQGLEKELGISTPEDEQLQSELDLALAELGKLKQRYSDSHPDIKALQKRIDSLRQQLNIKTEKGVEKKTLATTTSKQNPAYVELKLRIDSAEREIFRLRQRQDEIKQSLADYEKRVSQTNQVSRAYTELTRDHENTLAKYKDLRAKQLQAELAQNLESENKAESFTLLEPPQVPAKAEKPNRPKLMMMGVVGSVGAGMGLALLIEFLFGGVRGYNQIAQVVGKAPLVVIPVIATAHDIARRKTVRNRWIVFIILMFIGIIVAFHFYVMNLEILWFKVMRKIGQL